MWIHCASVWRRPFPVCRPCAQSQGLELMFFFFLAWCGRVLTSNTSNPCGTNWNSDCETSSAKISAGPHKCSNGRKSSQPGSRILQEVFPEERGLLAHGLERDVQLTCSNVISMSPHTLFECPYTFVIYCTHILFYYLSCANRQIDIQIPKRNSHNFNYFTRF